MKKKLLFILLFLNTHYIFPHNYTKIAKIRIDKPAYMRNIKVLDNYIIATSKYKIYKFSKEGKLIDELGNKGQGPGDFICTFSWDNDNYNIYVNDIKLLKLTVFNIKTLALTNSYIWNYGSPLPGMIAICKNKILKAQALWNHNNISYSTVLNLFDIKGELIKRFHKVGYYITINFRRELWLPLVSSDKKNYFYTIMQPIYKICKYDTRGNLVIEKKIERKWFKKLKKWNKQKYLKIRNKKERIKFYVNYLNSGNRITNIIVINEKRIAIQITGKKGFNIIEIFDNKLNFIKRIKTKYFMCNGKEKYIYFVEPLNDKYIDYNIWRYKI